MKIIINNKSDVETKVAMLMCERVLEKVDISTFHGFRYSGKSFTVVYKKNKHCIFLNIYNDFNTIKSI